MGHVKNNGLKVKKSQDNWALLYKIAGVSAIFSVSIIPAQIILFITNPPPEIASEFIALFQENSLLGLMSMDFLYLINNIIGLVLFPALCLSLWDTNKSLIIIALMLGVFGSSSFFVSNTSLNYLYLVQQYSESVTEAERSVYITAGEAMLALYKGTPYHMHYILGTISLLILSFLMLQSDHYKRSTGIIGLATNVIACGLYIPEVGAYISAFSAIGYIIWFSLIARRFFILSRLELYPENNSLD